VLQKTQRQKPSGDPRKRLIVGISGASGAVYGVRLLEQGPSSSSSPADSSTSSEDFYQWVFEIGQLRRALHGKTDMLNG
jgi:hypothetical protein